MTDETTENNEKVAAPEAEHPLLAAFHDMKRVAVTNKGLKALARVQHGIENRERWIENRKAQIEQLHRLSKDVLDAYDRGDSEDMNQIMREVEAIVAMSEGMGSAEIAVAEVLEDEEEDGPFPSKSRLPFKKTLHGGGKVTRS